MNVGETGVILAFSTGFNMSANTSLQILFWKPSNPWSEDTNSSPSLTKTAAIGTNNLPTTAGLFLANTYVTYTFLAGELNESGTWSARVGYTDIAQHLISDVAQFPVGS